MTPKLLRRGRDDNGRIHLFFISDDRVGCFRPNTQFVQNLSDVSIVSKSLAVDRLQNIAGLNTGLCRLSSWRHDTSLNTARSLNPRDPVVGRKIAALLLSVE